MKRRQPTLLLVEEIQEEEGRRRVAWAAAAILVALICGGVLARCIGPEEAYADTGQDQRAFARQMDRIVVAQEEQAKALTVMAKRGCR